ncbi:hypothetical protein FB45DRAFT_75261 [Roridomyces roridus]|uniref:DUF6533 domain-containing protein n=1 Tax=Roridomyces roridus TaxID=1738132 RepID=A0AAD7FLS3_9AGAR|nr:hypothetical protein FB45DRAFT_75261 [Roridomyces roridus]
MNLSVAGDSGALDYATFASDHRIIRYLFLAGLTVLIYDHLLSLSMEVKSIRSSKVRPSTCWFLVVRYLGLVTTLSQFPYYFLPLDHAVCLKLQWLWDVPIIVQEVLVEASLALRVIAMYGFNKWVFLGLATATSAVAATSLRAMILYGQHPDLIQAPGLAGCHPAFTRQ